MPNLVDDVGLAAAISGIGDQISTAINIEKVRQEIPGKNILINWYFKRPVNQREATGLINTPGYFIDRWKLVDGTVHVTDDGLVLDGTMIQILEYPVESVTVASALTADGKILEAEYNDDTRIFQVTSSGDTLIAAKLEIGLGQTLGINVDGKWLLRDPAPIYEEEFRLCKRYYFRGVGVSDGCMDAGKVRISGLVDGSITMRVVPDITVVRSPFYVKFGNVTYNGSPTITRYVITNHPSGFVHVQAYTSDFSDPKFVNETILSFAIDIIFDAEL